MRVRTLVEREHDGTTYASGQVIDAPDGDVQGWINDGTAEPEDASAYRSFEIMKSFDRNEVAEMSADEREKLHMARSGRMRAEEPDIEEAVKRGFDPANEPKEEVLREAEEARAAAEEGTAVRRRTTRRAGQRAETAARDTGADAEKRD